MVLLGFEPMTIGWDAWQRELKPSQEPLGQTCICVEWVKTRVDKGLDCLNLKKIKNTREACSSCLIFRNLISSSNPCFFIKLSEIKFKLDRFFITNMKMHVNFIYIHPNM